MRILFLKGSAVLSKLIIADTKEPVSHCALQLGPFIIHSNLLGVHIEWADNVLKKDQLVYSLVRNGSGVDSYAADLQHIGKLLDEYEWSMYDFTGFLFLGLAILLNTYLKIPMPKRNYFAISGQFLCTEWVSEFAEGIEESMLTPLQVYNKLKSSGKWKDEGKNEKESTETSTSGS